MYDFDTLLKRKETDCTKWDALVRDYGVDDLMPFWVADADFPIYSGILEAIRERAKDGNTLGYTFAGKSFYDTVIDWNARRHGLELSQEDILLVPGVVTAISVVLMATTMPNDRIMINPPVYSPFFSVIKENGRILEQAPLVNKNGRYELDFANIEMSFRKNNIKAYLLCSPHNPVGRVWTKEELRQLCDLCKKYNVLLISDEIHYDIVYAGHVHTPILNMNQDAVLITAPSKSFNIAGLKASFMFIKNEEIRKKVQKNLSEMHMYLNLFAFDAVKAAYGGGEQWLDEMVRYLHGNAEAAIAFLKKEMPRVRCYVPESTYLLWLDLSEYKMSEEQIRDTLINKAKLALNEGTEYGLAYDQFVRFNIAAPRSYVMEGLYKMQKAFEIQ